LPPALTTSERPSPSPSGPKIRNGQVVFTYFHFAVLQRRSIFRWRTPRPCCRGRTSHARV
jgi:hypothetical protein